MNGKPYIIMKEDGIVLYNSNDEAGAVWNKAETKEDYLKLIDIARSLHFGDGYVGSLFKSLYGYEWGCK